MPDSGPPQWAGRSAFLHGFARSEVEGPPSGQPTTWWGSAATRLPDGVAETMVRLQAEDGGHSRGILYRRGGEATAVFVTHPQGDFSSHYLAPTILSAGFAVFGAQMRTLANDSDCIHETLLADIAAGIRYLRAVGFERIVLLGNSGGGSLLTFYQAQASISPPGRLTDTPAGDPYDLNALDMPPGDALVLLGAHLGEGVYALHSIDPSVTDESDPFSCDPSLDMFNPDNGYREPPEETRYTEEFLARYRAGQRARCERLDAMAREDIQRRRSAREAMSAPGFSDLPLRDRLEVSRDAHCSKYVTVARVNANPAFADMSIESSPRARGSILGVDPHATNYRIGGFASTMTPEAWLSTWSGLSSRAAVLQNIKFVEVPLLVVNYSADTVIFPRQAEQIFQQAGSFDKAMSIIDADHYAHPTLGTHEESIQRVGDAITTWLTARFG